MVVRSLLESVHVLATGKATRDIAAAAGGASSSVDLEGSYSTITLDVTPEQAQQLAVGLRMGELIPMLRGAGDEAPTGLDALGDGRLACRGVARDRASSAAGIAPGACRSTSWSADDSRPASPATGFPPAISRRLPCPVQDDSSCYSASCMPARPRPRRCRRGAAAPTALPQRVDLFVGDSRVTCGAHRAHRRRQRQGPRGLAGQAPANWC